MPTQLLDQQNDSQKFLLYAVNVMLQMINETPISDDIELVEILEARIASEVLIETKKEILAEGWDFNRDVDYEFPPTILGIIPIGSDVLNITDKQGRYTMREWKLYDKQDKTFQFDAPQTLDVIWDMDFNTLAHPLRNLITIRAARKFQARTVMDSSVYSYSKEDEEDAFIIARRAEGFTGNYNMLTSAYGVNNVVYN